jgi:hypothetical protein
MRIVARPCRPLKRVAPADAIFFIAPNSNSRADLLLPMLSIEHQGQRGWLVAKRQNHRQSKPLVLCFSLSQVHIELYLH